MTGHSDDSHVAVRDEGFCRSTTARLLRRWLGPACLVLGATAVPSVATSAATPVDLDEVACTLCHWQQGDAFAQSIHYNSGMLLCTDCHGGLPFEVDNELAKAPETGFIGRPQRQDIARVCGACHAASVQFFAQGPHADIDHAKTPTCITCHGNHDVRDATLALMDSTCTPCHEAGSEALAAGDGIRDGLERAAAQLAAVSALVDSLAAQDRNLRRTQPFVAAARTALRDADAQTHALNASMTAGGLAAFTRELDGARERIAVHGEARQQRRLAVASVWVFIAFNLLVLWAKRRQLN